ncbi:DUF1003 domain-containing protein [Acidiferrimicrobium sp. IK]|uniref:DUF1003 domain-containing protein n=1 Tax=Acidiferrimicrobium sp. IK TaxID=2871700 RepID=UPI0021CB5212|nr:DUF1003 domain-containing protein [Acidiferrimicrobium sp. IK]MCU4187312.1 DUF1003 domain-containing protein [Acidiferrimicrobium sp. IK]
MARIGTRRIRRHEDLTTPRGSSVRLGPHYDPEAFGRFSEGIARLFGTARFLAIQTVIVAFWIALNSVGIINHWDPYPFILLNLLFSTQAAYAAPLILLAQNRQDERDRENIERDRNVATRTQADTEFLARELASVRLALAGMATTDDLDSSFERLEATMARVEQRLGRLDANGSVIAGGAAEDAAEDAARSRIRSEPPAG